MIITDGYGVVMRVGEGGGGGGNGSVCRGTILSISWILGWIEGRAHNRILNDESDGG